jgi:DnaJ homologue, subfamily C, member 28, conserved domain
MVVRGGSRALVEWIRTLDGEVIEMPESESRPQGGAQPPNRERARDARTGSDAVAARIQHQARWVDLQIQRAMERGEFDNLPGQGKPLGDLGSPEDRDWWLRKLVEREQITGVLPAALQLRKEARELDALLDRETVERQVRELVEDFNRRIIEARRQLQGGPPVVTPTRDVETEVERWRERQGARRSRQVDRRAEQDRLRRRRWLRRRRPPDEKGA